MTAPQPATPGSDSVRAQIAEALCLVEQQQDRPAEPEGWVPFRHAGSWRQERHLAQADALLPLVDRLRAEAKAEGEERGYERAQNECPPGGWETGL